MANRVIIPLHVSDQIEDIGAYIATDNFSAAIESIKRLYTRCQSLETFPLRGALYASRYRRILEGSYQIIYRIEESDDDTKVIIVAVRHQSQDTFLR